MIKNFIVKMNKIFKIDTNKFVKSKKNISNLKFSKNIIRIIKNAN